MTMEQNTPAMRSWRERAAQTVAYEIGGVALITPLFASATDTGVTESLTLIIVLSLAFLLWTFVFNWTFDFIEHRSGGGPASARPHRLRILHAASLEFTSVIVTLPILMWMIGLTFWEAVMVEIGLSLAYAIYAYLFFLAFDRIRPISA